LRSDSYVVPQKGAEEAVEKIKELKIGHAKEAADANGVRAASIINLFVVISILIGIFSVVFGLWLSSKISKPVKMMAERAERLKSLCITNLGKAAEAMAKGDLNVQVETGTTLLEMTSKDEIGMLANSIDGIIRRTQATVASFEQALAKIRGVVEETTHLTVAAQEGRLSERGNAENYQGGYRELVQGFNGTLDAITTPITEASDVLQRVAARDLTTRMQGNYRGDFAKSRIH
jgi:methyl-accepting chemotaxis protein